MSMCIHFNLPQASEWAISSAGILIYLVKIVSGARLGFMWILV